MILPERFESKFIPEPNSGCWLWIGRSLGRQGSQTSAYGTMLFYSDAPGWGWRRRRKPHPRRCQLAHRVSWELHRGPIPEGMYVLHRCDQPCCVNPDHLFLGTIADNIKDMVSKGRSRAGTKHHAAKLSDDLVREIRRLPGSQEQLARRFSVGRRTISDIKRRATWSHVE